MLIQRVPVGVTGVGVICAAGRDTSEFWANVIDGVGKVGAATQGEVAGFPNAFVGEIPDEWLTAMFTSHERTKYDRATLLSIASIREALGQAGLTARQLPDERTALILGKCQAQPALSNGQYAQIHCTGEEISEAFGITGPRVMVSTACAAGANAVGMGRDKLWNGEVDVAIAGGVDVLLAATYVGFGALQALAPAPCAPYSRSDGLSLGEGAAFLILERIPDAEARGARVLAEVRGYGLSADAYHPTAPDPTGRGAVSAVERALADASATPADVTYVNGHGTGTPTNDRMERKAMRVLFGDRTPEVPISGTKSFIGHTLGASGAIEAVVCTLAIIHELLPPTANFDDDAASPEGFNFVAHRGQPASVDLTVSTNYAFGGNNAALAMSRQRANTPREMEHVADPVITGLGPVGPLGVGIDEWRRSFEHGVCAVSAVNGSTTLFAATMGRLKTRPYTDPKKWRQMSELGKQCVAATALALADGGLDLTKSVREELGLILASGYGPMEDAISFDRDRNTSPKVSAFANITMNSPAGAVSRAFALRGPTTTLTVGRTSTLHAIHAAADMIAQRKTDACVIVAADELSPEMVPAREAMADPGWISTSGHPRPYDSRRDGTHLGHAVVAILIESRASAIARGARIYARLAGWQTTGHDQPITDSAECVAAYGRVIERVLDQANLAADDIAYCVGSAAGTDIDVVEARAFAQHLKPGTPLSAPAANTGDCEAASAAIGLLCGALAVAYGETAGLEVEAPVPDLTLSPSGRVTDRVVNALVGVMEPGGDYGAIVLSAAEGTR